MGIITIGGYGNMSENLLVREETKAVVYDLPSENQLRLPAELKAKVRNIRVQCTYALHKLGLQCTESVILVSPHRVSQIEETIREVREAYEALARREGLDNFEPQIYVIPIYQTQYQPMRNLAVRRLQERLDESIDRISRVLETIDEITEEARRRQLKYRLNQLRREWLTIQQIANELGVDVSRDLEYLLELIDQARGRIQ